MSGSRATEDEREDQDERAGENAIARPRAASDRGMPEANDAAQGRATSPSVPGRSPLSAIDAELRGSNALVKEAPSVVAVEEDGDNPEAASTAAPSRLDERDPGRTPRATTAKSAAERDQGGDAGDREQPAVM